MELTSVDVRGWLAEDVGAGDATSNAVIDDDAVCTAQILAKEPGVVAGLRAVAAAEGRIIAAEELGKYKMVLQAIAVQGLLIHYTYFAIDFFAAGLFILWIALGLSVWSGVEYFHKGFRLLTAPERTQAIKRAAM